MVFFTCFISYNTNIKKDSYSLRVETVTDQTISEDYVIKADSRFRVDAEVLGI